VTKPYSQPCENNKKVILEILASTFANTEKVLELGSGTGQHAVYFSEHLPHLLWQTSDLAENHSGINAWVDSSPRENLLRPITCDANVRPWQVESVDGIFTANTLHIMGEKQVELLFEEIGQVVASTGDLCIYGPFNYEEKFTSQSNERFQDWLVARDPVSGIRDFEWICELAENQALKLVADHEMPANNRLLHFQRR